MEDVVKKLTNDVYVNLIRNLIFFWPTSGTGWPHENNIGVILAQIAPNYGFNRIYSEVYMNGQHRDMIIINESQKIFIQLEFKHMYYKNIMDEAISNDLWRVYLRESADKFFEDTDRNRKFKDYQKYGLFLAFGKNELYTIWEILDKDMEQKTKKYLQGCGFDDKTINDEIQIFKNWFNSEKTRDLITFGIWRDKNLNDKLFGNLWLGYYFIKCGDED